MMSERFKMVSTVLAIGAHIGDMDLTAGPILATLAQQGKRVVIVALTNGESGHPKLSPAAYRTQKLQEGEQFATDIGGSFISLGYQDGYLPDDDSVANRIVELIVKERPDIIIGHWKHSIHRDHERASQLMDRARFLASLPKDDNSGTHSVKQVLYADNWEDAEGYVPSSYVAIPDSAFATWRTAIEKEAFARGETGFGYINYYVANMKLKGALVGLPYACVVKSARWDLPELQL